MGSAVATRVGSPGGSRSRLQPSQVPSETGDLPLHPSTRGGGDTGLAGIASRQQCANWPRNESLQHPSAMSNFLTISNRRTK